MESSTHYAALVLTLAAILAAASGHAIAYSQSPTETGESTELDPLTREEKSVAEQLVRADPRAAELLGKDATLASIEFLAVKGRVVRHADLLFARPSADYGARALVELGAKPQVVEFTRVDARSVPMTQSDVDEVWRIALADSAYVSRLGRSPDRLVPEALRMYSQDPDDPCFRARCYYLIVRDGDFYVSNASAIVDVSNKRILTDRRSK